VSVTVVSRRCPTRRIRAADDTLSDPFRASSTKAGAADHPQKCSQRTRRLLRCRLRRPSLAGHLGVREVLTGSDSIRRHIGPRINLCAQWQPGRGPHWAKLLWTVREPRELPALTWEEFTREGQRRRLQFQAALAQLICRYLTHGSTTSNPNVQRDLEACGARCGDVMKASPRTKPTRRLSSGERGGHWRFQIWY
jgi:hypothetical protein